MVRIGVVSSAAGLAAAAALIGLVAAGCNGGGGGGGGPDGEVAISLTDAPADDVSVFDVEVLSIGLTRSDGLVVNALPTRQRVDFADLVSVAELVSVVRVPAGAYTDLSLVLNLVNSPGTVPAATTTDVDGVVARILTATAAAKVLDVNGNEFTGPVTLPVRLDPRTPLVVIPGSARLLSLDFDLDGSLVVDVAANTIKVLPLLKAEVEPRRARTLRVRGPLLTTDAAAQSFTLALRPRPNVTPFGSITVDTNGLTYFEVNGQTAFGQNGFALLAAQPTATAVVVHGFFIVPTRRYVATAVEAGSSVTGGTLDIVEGHVTAKSGNDLTVRGLTLARGTGAVAFNQVVTVTTGPGTFVAKRLQGNLTPAAIGVGQHVIAAGTLVGQTMGSAPSPTPFVRLIQTAICGDIVSPASGGSMTVDVKRIGRLPFTAFTSPAANPWTVALGTISVTAPATTPVIASGFVLTTTANFQAESVTDISDFSVFFAGWEPAPMANPVSASSPTSITFDISGTPALLRFTVTGCDPPVLLPAGSMMVRPSGNPQGLFVTRLFAGPTLVFTNFGDWVDDINARAAAGDRPRRLTAVGRLNAGRTEIASDAASITME